MNSCDFAVLIVRLALGGMLAAHGYHKIFLGGGLVGNGRWFEQLGMRPGWLHVRFAAASEIAAGVAMAAGLFTAAAAAVFVALMLVAFWTVHRRNGFFIMTSGWEYNLLIAVTAVGIAGLGAGRLSIERVLFGHNVIDGWVGIVVAAGLGIAGGAAQLVLFYRPARMVAA
ncbi:DoxX family protein [Nocardia sp. NPDC051030]|uniref:DoxX family protein n=1 Tax=Nocardia sp. NPDC051030 TaxID=3155162 RepID=UPI00343E6B80